MDPESWELIGELWVARLGSGDVVVADLHGGEQSGEMEVVFLWLVFTVSADRGWRRSGLRARRSSGDPGSVDLGREKDDFLLGVRLETLALPGEKVWVALEEPGWWPQDSGRASGDGVRVGEIGGGIGPGDGVRASGDSGMCPTDFRREGEWRFLVLMCSLCLRPCREEGRVLEDTVTEDDTGLVITEAGEVRELSADSVNSPGDEMGDSDSGEGEWSLLAPAPGDNNGSLSDWSEELADNIPAISAEARLLDNFLNNELVFRLLSASRFLCLSLAAVAWVLLAILMVLGSRLRPPVLMLVDSMGVARMVTASPPLMRSWSTWVWTRPWTGSLLMWVTRSLARSPASYAGDPLSTSITKWWMMKMSVSPK